MACKLGLLHGTPIPQAIYGNLMLRLSLLLPLTSLMAAPLSVEAQCVSTLTYSPAHPVSGQSVTFVYTLNYVPGYTPPQGVFNEELFYWNTGSGGDVQQSGLGDTLFIPGSATFSVTPFYAGLFTASASSEQAYAYGQPLACGPANGRLIGSNVSVLVAPSGQTPPFGQNQQVLSLKGQYVFQFQGSTPEALPTNRVVAIGSFTADGNSNIVAGAEDLNSADSSRADIPILGGSYTINGATGSIEVLTSLGAQHFDIFNSIDRGSGIQNAVLIYTDGTPLGSGTLTKQSPFDPSGAYFVNLQGAVPADAGLQNIFTPAVLVGLVTLSNGSTSAYLDQAYSGIGVRKGIYEQGSVEKADVNGRFTYTLKSDSFTLQPTHFVGYTIDASHFVTISLDNYQTNYLFSGTGAQ